ncbi:MAG TPA: hypothetical protein DEF51_05180 [Myxococcales bacterium]|nr:hypothetical protein [Myxococcales bacterium]
MTRALCLTLLLVACAEEPAPDAPTSAASESERPSDEQGQRLGVPPAQLARARREASGLSHLSPALRRQALAGQDADDQPSYVALRRDADAHADASVHLRGRVGLVRPAGGHLWILALMLRREDAGWRDPLYVLSVVEPDAPPEGGALVRVHGWVVGERTIGRHALPLVLAYAVEPEPE